jgi:hypothetical protein
MSKLSRRVIISNNILKISNVKYHKIKTNEKYTMLYIKMVKIYMDLLSLI